MNPVVDLAIRTARSLGVVGVTSWIRRRSSAVASRQSESDFLDGQVGDDQAVESGPDGLAEESVSVPGGG